MSKVQRRLFLASSTLLVLGLWLIIFPFSFNWPLVDDFGLIDFYSWRFVTHEYSALDLFLNAHNGSHPLGLFATLSVSIFKIFGINFTYLVFTSFVALVLSAIFVSLCLPNATSSKTLFVALHAGILIVLFHPAEANHILWPYELSWFLITLLLSLNVFLVERYGLPGAVAALPVALLACTCSAHGIFLLPTAALHIWLKDSSRWRYPLIATCLILFAIAVVVISRMNPVDDAPPKLTQFFEILIYGLSLLGGMFGQRKPVVVFALGFGLCACALFILANVWRARANLRAPDRIALVLLFVSATMILAFALGRFRNGLDWAFVTFHAAPLCVPFLLAILIWFLPLASRPASSIPQRVLALSPPLFVMASAVFAFPYAAARAPDVWTQRALAKYAVCSSTLPPEIVANINGGGVELLGLINRAMPLLSTLCKEKVPDSTLELITFPMMFNGIIEKQPEAAAPLRELWNVYLMRGDLRNAIGTFGNDRGPKLLNFAINNAKGGSNYLPEKLSQYADFFMSLVEP